jgi:hypothetical protein
MLIDFDIGYERDARTSLCVLKCVQNKSKNTKQPKQQPIFSQKVPKSKNNSKICLLETPRAKTGARLLSKSAQEVRKLLNCFLECQRAKKANFLILKNEYEKGEN